MQKILSEYNLTAALRERYTNVAVKIIVQELACATVTEQELLQINEAQSWIREIYLQGDGINIIHARVVAPYATYKAFQVQFDALGDSFLGESFLYQIPHTRSPFEYKQINDQWLRWSIFYIENNKLIVSELFL